MEALTSSSSTSAASNHAVSRSKELLSCCKTAWKIQQQQIPTRPDQPTPSMPVFQLAPQNEAPPLSLVILEDGLTLLRAMEFGLKQLQVLVRRRGHTNDPTQEIGTLVQQLEQDTQELTEFCQQLLQKRRSSKQDKKHWEFVVQWFQQVAQQYSSQLQKCLKVRGDVLANQAQQRKKILVDKKKGTVRSSNARPTGRGAATPLFDSPLFKAPPPPRRPAASASAVSGPPPPISPYANGTSIDATTGTSNGATVSTPSSATTNLYSHASNGTASGARTIHHPYGGYGSGATASGGYGGNVGYGGTGSYGGGMGMRQRKGESVSGGMTAEYNNGGSSNYYSQQQVEEEEEEKVHSQIQMRQQKRQTQQRLDEARQAETMLGELGQLFGKMSNLIVQQGEVLEKIEDDVEAAKVDVFAGQEELTNLYSLKKGNRPLIIKTFLILNFLIVFMSFYRKK